MHHHKVKIGTKTYTTGPDIADPVPPVPGLPPQPPAMVPGEWRKNFKDGMLGPEFRVRPTLIHSGAMVQYNDLTKPEASVHDGYAELICRKASPKWNGTLIATSQDGDGPTFGYGRFEVLCRANVAYSTWQAFWFLTTKPYTGYEIDWPEMLEALQVSAHVLGLSNLPTKYLPAPADWATTWHLFWTEKRADSVTFGIDATTVHTVKAPQPADKQALLAQSVVGFPWEGPPDSRTPNPTWFQIAWVRALPL